MTIFVFGNPDLSFDSLPLQILPKLHHQFPKINFKVLDPNEEWQLPDNLIVIDTVIGLNKPKIFTSLDHFDQSPHISLHDFDVLTNLRYLQKLGKLKKITIFGLPPDFSKPSAMNFLINNLG